MSLLFHEIGTRLASLARVTDDRTWRNERAQLLDTPISEMGLAIAGTRVERLCTQLYDEFAQRDVAFRPPVYLSDEWGCPDGTALIGVPFYLADTRLELIEAEHAGDLESDVDSMRYLRHEAGHAINYAFRLYEHREFSSMFGDYARPYESHFATDPLSRSYVRHILGWYAQKHPDEDFAETFAVWLTPSLNWRQEYAGWPALEKLEWMDEMMRSIAHENPLQRAVEEDDIPVESMEWTLREHYEREEALDVGDGSQFDADLRRIFARDDEAPLGEDAGEFITRHEGELVARVSYWAAVGPAVIRSLLVAIRTRTRVLRLRLSGLEASALIELTAFGTAVLLHWRYTSEARVPTHDDEVE